MALGALPSDYFVGDTIKLNLTEEYSDWWTVPLNNIAYGHQSISSTEHFAILDTGSSLLILQYSDYVLFAEMIYNIGVFDCSGPFCHSFENTCDYYYDLM